MQYYYHLEDSGLNSISLAPIVLFVYNRPWHTRQTVEALRKNKLAKESELFIYSDAPKNKEADRNVKAVRKYIRNITGFKKVTIIERKKNLGLANSIIEGVTDVVNKYGKIIVLEDDLVTSPYFLKYMNDGLIIFKDNKNIFSITGFNFPPSIFKIPQLYKENIYLSYRCMSWGWGTWLNRWLKVDWQIKDFHKLANSKEKINLFNKGGKDLYPMLKNQLDGKIDSWAIRFCYAHYKNNAFCVYPIISFIKNIGFDGSGVHCGDNKKFMHKSLNNYNFNINGNIKVDNEIIENFYKISKKSIVQRIKNSIKWIQ